MPYKFIEHTADIAVEVEGKTIDELFVSACNAWRDSVLEIDNMKNSNLYVNSKKFIYNSASLEELLIELLSELNFQLYTKKWIYISTKKILIQKLNTTFHLDIEVFGLSYNPDIHHIKEEIKAVTFHQMKIEEKNGNLFTRIIFDI